MSARREKKCRCQAPLNDAGECPYRCPAPDGRRRHSATGIHAQPDALLSAREVSAGMRKVGVPRLSNAGYARSGGLVRGRETGCDKLSKQRPDST